jgi:hypothetical protein
MATERYLIKDVCEYCKNPVYADEGYHGISQNHYSCQDEQTVLLDKAIAKIDELADSLGIKRKRKKVREGEGKVAQKCIKLATEAFERETGGTVTNALIWNQQGQYRGPQWDLACFGVDFEFTLEGSDHIFRGSIASWSTMTAVSKLKEMQISPSNISYMYEH